MSDHSDHDAEIDGLLAAIGMLQAELDRLRAQVLPPWTCVSPDGRRWQVVHPDMGSISYVPAGASLADVAPYARLLPFGVDSAGNVVAGEGGGGA